MLAVAIPPLPLNIACHLQLVEGSIEAVRGAGLKRDCESKGVCRARPLWPPRVLRGVGLVGVTCMFEGKWCLVLIGLIFSLIVVVMVDVNWSCLRNWLYCDDLKSICSVGWWHPSWRSKNIP